MLALLDSVLVAIALFAATNADDLVLLTIFFSRPGSAVRTIVAGQLAGLGVLVALSYLAAMLSLTVPHTWIPWIGLVPVAIGITWLFRPKDNDAPPEATTWWTVAGVTIANGSDNLGVYIPAFAIQSRGEKVVTVFIFAVLTFLWCWLARSATRHATWGVRISRFCRDAGPYVLIAVGLWIIAHHPVFGLRLSHAPQ